MNTKELKKLAEQESKSVVTETEKGVVIEPQTSTKEYDNSAFVSKTQQKKHKQLKSHVDEITQRQETEVVSSGIYLKTSVAGNSVVGNINDMRITISHKDIARYYEGLTNQIEVFQIVPKKMR